MNRSRLMSKSTEQAGRTEALFREVNERIVEEVGPWDVELVCECADAGCIEHVRVPLREYEEIRSHSTWFVIRQGHADEEIERVVERRRTYDLVEKFDPDAAAVARATD